MLTFFFLVKTLTKLLGNVRSAPLIILNAGKQGLVRLVGGREAPKLVVVTGSVFVVSWVPFYLTYILLLKTSL